MSRSTVSDKTRGATVAAKPVGRRELLSFVTLVLGALAGEFAVWYVMAGRDITAVILLGILLAAIIIPVAAREAYLRLRVGRNLGE